MQPASRHSIMSTGRMGTPSSCDRSRSRGLPCPEHVVARTLFPTPEQLPRIGQALSDWIRQEVNRGRVLATQGMNANSDMTNVITVQRIADLLLAGNARAAQRHVADIRHSI